MNYNELLKLVQDRRSIRRFKPDPIPEDYIAKIIEVARWAPSGFNSQPWEFVVVKDPELKAKIVKICKSGREQAAEMEATREAWQGKPAVTSKDPDANAGDYAQAPVYIILCGDTRTRQGLPMARRVDPYRWETVFISGLASAFIYMHLAATTLGLGSQWVSAVSTNYGQVMLKDLLALPEEMEIYDMMALGYPAYKARPKLLRDEAKMVHYDRAGEADFRTDEEVRDFIRRTREWNIASEKRKADK